MYKRILHVIFILLTLAHVAQTWAFGVVDSVIGNASVSNLDGDVRTLLPGERIEVNDTIVTADDGELLVQTDEQGLLLLRSGSKLFIERNTKGLDQNLFALRLFKGSIYGETGMLGVAANGKYRISTPHGEVYLNNAQYDIGVAIQANKLATFVKLTKGDAKLSTRDISIRIEEQGIGVMTLSEAPRSIVLEPQGLFTSPDPSLNLQALNEKNTQKLVKRTESNQRQANSRIVDDCVSDSPAQQVLNDFIDAYERADIAYIQRRLDPAMVGYSAFLSNMMKDINVQKQNRFLIQNRNVQCGPDLAVINFKWEKRYLDLATFRPRLQTGQAAVLTHLKDGQWKLSGISGDNPFAPRLNQATTLIASPNAISLNVVGATPVTSQIKLISPDLEGLGTVQVIALASTGDRETFVLNEVQPGVFIRNNFNVIDTIAAPNNGFLSVSLSGVTTITFQYTNLNSGLIATDVITFTEI